MRLWLRRGVLNHRPAAAGRAVLALAVVLVLMLEACFGLLQRERLLLLPPFRHCLRPLRTNWQSLPSRRRRRLRF